MPVYIAALTIALIIGYKAGQEKNVKACLCIIVSGFPFILVSGLRYYVGTDYRIYRDIFNIIRNGGTLKDIEDGYLWLNKIVSCFAADYQSIMFVTAVITITLYFISIYLLSSDIPMSILIWFCSLCFFESLNTVRQSLAMSIFFVAIYFIYKRKWFLYLLFIVIASRFHMSAIVLAVVYWIVNRKSDIKWHVFSLIGIFTSALFIRPIFLRLPLPDRYMRYFEAMTHLTDFRIMDFFISFVVWGAAWYYHQFVKEEGEKKYDIFLNLQFLAVVISSISGNLPMAYRLLMYFVYIPTFMISEILQVSYSVKNQRFIKIIIMLVYAIQWAYYVFIVGIVDFIKYTSILSR